MKEKGGKFRCKERRSGHYYRSIPLRGVGDIQECQSKLENGVLKLEIPKAKEKRQSIQIQ